MVHNKRISELRTFLKAGEFDGAIISSRSDVYYYTGTYLQPSAHREALLFVTPKNALLYHSPFLTPKKTSRLELLAMSASVDLASELSTFFGSKSPSMTLGFQDTDLSVSEHQRLSKQLESYRLTPLPTSFPRLRVVKDSDELAIIRRTCSITAATMSWIQDWLGSDEAHGVTELTIRHMIEQHFYELGAHDVAFPTIVAFGPHSALPHHMPTDTKLEAGDVVLLDFGCSVDGYASDMTRTMSVGTSPDSRFATLEKIVLGAYAVAFKKLADKKVTAASVDAAARKHIARAGYGREFIHTTGHGLGLSVHEQPSLNSRNDSEILSRTVITIEPGIYLTDLFGYRHENTILMSETGPEVLTK